MSRTKRRKPLSQRRIETIQLRVTTGEKREIERTAALHRVTVSEWLRWIALGPRPQLATKGRP